MAEIFPSFRYLLAEIRVFRELLSFLFSDFPETKEERVVMFIPGFMSCDAYLFPVIRRLNKKGICCYGWGMGVNTGYREKVKNSLVSRVERVAGAGKITLIGWSMGGVYAREVCYELPEKVELVVTLGSPFRIEGRLFNMIYKTVSGNTLSELNRVLERQKSYQLPLLQVYSIEDGVVPWESCAFGESCVVGGTHLGLPYNSQVIKKALEL